MLLNLKDINLIPSVEAHLIARQLFGRSNYKYAKRQLLEQCRKALQDGKSVNWKVVYDAIEHAKQHGRKQI